jgi:hypothetical protein
VPTISNGEMMANSQGELSPSDKGTLDKWLSDHTPVCPVSKDSDWWYRSYLILKVSYRDTGQGAGQGSRAYAEVAFVCLACGYLMYVDAAVIGIIQYSGSVDSNG